MSPLTVRKLVRVAAICATAVFAFEAVIQSVGVIGDSLTKEGSLLSEFSNVKDAAMEAREKDGSFNPHKFADSYCCLRNDADACVKTVLAILSGDPSAAIAGGEAE